MFSILHRSRQRLSRIQSTHGGTSLIALVLIMLGTLNGNAIDPQPADGIILFTTAKSDEAAYTPLDIPGVQGAELIVFWGEVEPEEGKYDWSAVDRLLSACKKRGQTLDIRLATAHAGPDYTPPWVYDNYNIRRIGRGRWLDAETPITGYQLLDSATITDSPDLIISGNRSILAVNKDLNHAPFMQTTRQPSLQAPCKRLFLQFDLKALDDSTVSLKLESATGGTDATQLQKVTLPAGESQTVTMTFETQDYPDYRLLWGLEGMGRIALDNVNIIPLINEVDFQITDFESNALGWELHNGASLTREPSQTLNGEGSLLLRNSDENRRLLLSNNPELLPIDRDRAYSWRFEAHAIKDTTIELREYKDEENWVIKSEFVLKAGENRTCKAGGYYVPEDGYRLELGLAGPGEVIIDDLRYKTWSDRVTTFPNYFDPILLERWGRMLNGFAERYHDHPAMGTISVGGFGRWEEVMLDDDTYGALDRQWLAVGFTQERYLKHIESCMDLYKRKFPDHPLRICLAYGLHNVNNIDWIYRRVAQAAIARKIGLKQNGLSEKYDSWNRNTNASYLFKQYASLPGVHCTFETGGQLFRNSADAMGHPLSLINRALIDGTDALWLYAPDIIDPQINKYFDYYHALAGNALFTRYYNLFDRHEIAYRQTRETLYNQWLGLRQITPEYSEITSANGKRGVLVTSDHPLILDVDDRQQRAGMYGATLAIESISIDGKTDAPTGAVLAIRDASSGSWHEQHFQATAAWKTGYWPIGRLFDSSRDGGEDFHEDIKITSPMDALLVHQASLDFVPAQAWSTTNIKEEILPLNWPAQNYENIASSETWEIPVDTNQGIAFFAVPLWAGDAAVNRVRLDLAVLIDGAWVPSTRKEAYIFRNAEWLKLPIAHTPVAQAFRLTFTALEGEVGIYLSEREMPAYRLEAYQRASTPASPATTQAAAPDESFVAIAPFFALDVNEGYEEAEAFSLQRKLFDGSWQTVSALFTTQAGTKENTTWYHEPQTAGIYRIAGAADNAVGLAAQPIYLERTQTPRAPRTLPDHHIRKVVNTTEDSYTGNFASRSELQHPAQRQDHLRFMLHNASSSPLARVRWCGEGEAFNAETLVTIPIVPNDTFLREYIWPIGRETSWSSQIDRIKIELFDQEQSAGLVQWGDINITAPTTVLDWTFDHDTQRFRALEEYGKTALQSSTMIAQSGKSGIGIKAPGSSIDILTEEGQTLVIMMQNETDASRGRIVWMPRASKQEPGHSWLANESNSIEFDLVANDTEMRRYQIDLYEAPGWSGNILEMAIICSGAEGQWSIDRLSIENKKNTQEGKE